MTPTITVTIEAEPFETFWADATALIAQHWAEIALHPDIPLNIDLDTYHKVAAAGRLVLLVARREREIVGYVAFLLAPHPHYRQSLQGIQDVFYVAPAERGSGIGAALLRESERVLKARGVQIVSQHVKIAHEALGHLLAQHGYEAAEILYTKRLDRE